ncbi:MAG: MBL fold metallo-hydrolase [Candidatus Bathyarchaeota archaeon]|nr:MBL fold metallo-hydrolase [Candidatus Bathyarchaeota archaeon]
MIEKIMSDLYLIKVPIPNNPLKATNSYIIKGKDNNLIIDTGVNLKKSLNTILSGLKKIDVDLENTDFFITHLHSDHLDLALVLATNSSRIYFNQPDAEAIRGSNEWNDELYNIARVCGFPEDRLQEVIKKYSWHRYREIDPEIFTILKEGDTIDVGDFHFKFVETKGHSRGHMCLYESRKKLLFAGDHILSDITPNISLWSYDGNPLKDYLDSLDKVYELDIELTLPGHRSFIRDCRKRINELKLHHKMRAIEIISILKKGRRDAFQIASKMNWEMAYDSWKSFAINHKMFATLETIAHLKYLEEDGFIQKETQGQKILFSIR